MYVTAGVGESGCYLGGEDSWCWLTGTNDKQVQGDPFRELGQALTCLQQPTRNEQECRCKPRLTRSRFHHNRRWCSILRSVNTVKRMVWIFNSTLIFFYYCLQIISLPYYLVNYTLNLLTDKTKKKSGLFHGQELLCLAFHQTPMSRVKWLITALIKQQLNSVKRNFVFCWV